MYASVLPGSLMFILLIGIVQIMTETLQNSYLQRYEQRQQSKESRSIHKSINKSPASPLDSIPPNSLSTVVSKLQERVDGIDVKMTSLVNVVKLLQRYTETKDDQYQKQKESEFFKKTSDSQCNHHCSQFQLKLKQFDIMTKQFREELKNVDRIKASLVINQMQSQRQGVRGEDVDLEEIEDRLREEINKKMQICVKLINSGAGGAVERSERGLIDKVNEMAFDINQLQNECKRNRMVLEKDMDRLTSMLKDSSTAIPTHSRLTEREASKSPKRVNLTHNKSKNSRSDKSLSKGKQNKSAVLINAPKQHSKVREEEMKQALRKKRQHREKLKGRNM